ncbi:MAG: winged helix-turn-helix domain-containing protein [Paracoccaceae bacterium]
MIYSFGQYEVDTLRQTLLHDGEEVALEPQVYRLLVMLLAAEGNVVTTDRIIEEIWDGRIVSEAAISSRIYAVRNALGDDGRSQALVRTVRGTGFRFVGEVTTRSDSGSTEAPVPARTSDRSGDKPVLAILPFHQDSSAAQDLLAESLVEGLTTALSRVRDFAVIARQSVLVSAEGNETGVQAARRLGATYVIEGMVRRAGERVRANVSLTHTPDAHCLWSQQFDDRIDDVFSLQDRLVIHVTGQLAPNIRAVEVERAKARTAGERSAYELTLTALPLFWRGEREAHFEAEARLRRATEIDPGYAPAQAYLAWCMSHGANAMWATDPDTTYARAAAQARAAIPLAGDHAPSLVAIGAGLTLSSNDMSQARAVLERALAYDPSNAWGWMRYGFVLYMDGEPARGLEALDRAEQLSPFDPFLFNVWFARAICHFSLGDVAAAERANAEGARLQPDIPWAGRQLLSFRIMQGDADGARKAAQRLLGEFPDLTARSVLASLPPGHPQKNNDFLTALKAAGLPD